MLDLVGKIAQQGRAWDIIEVFKEHFCRADGDSAARSSTESWAHSDMHDAARRAGASAPLFLAAYFDACEEIGQSWPEMDLPGTDVLNRILATNRLDFRIEGAELVPGSATPVPAHTPRLSTSTTVKRALDDAERLLQTGAASAVDRAHTALHAYLYELCEAAGIEHRENAEATTLFKLLRQQHPALQPRGARADDITRILKACASILDLLSPIRNKASLAHPNQLLDEPEALAVLNAARTLLRYIDDSLAREQVVSNRGDG